MLTEGYHYVWINVAGDKLWPCQQPGFLRSRGNVMHNNFKLLSCIGGGVSYRFYRHMCSGRHYDHWFMLVDVMPKCMGDGMLLWQML